MNRLGILAIISALFVNGVYASFVAAQTLPQAFTLDGTLYSDVNGTNPLVDQPILLTVQILNQNQDCILYEESSTVDTTTTAGRFALQIGSLTTGPSSVKRGANDSAHSMVSVYSNKLPISGKLVSNSAVCTYTPALADQRFLRVVITPPSGSQQILSPNLTLDSVPTALVAESLQGSVPTDFVQTDSTSQLTQTNVANIFSNSNYPLLAGLLGGTSTQYVKQSSGAATIPNVAGNPASPTSGQMWFDSSGHAMKYYDGTSVLSFGISGSGISSLTVGNSLTVNGTAGGTLTTPGTIDLANSGVSAGTYPKITVDVKGRVTAGASLAETDLPVIVTAGKVSGNAVITGTIGGNTVIYSSGNITSLATVTGATVSSGVSVTRGIQLYDPAPASTHRINISAPTLAADYSFIFPATAGAAGYALTTDGSGNLSWAASGAGSVTSVGLALPSIFTVTTPTVTGSGTLTAALANQSTSLVLAGPATGSAAAPTFRALAATDLPAGGYDSSYFKQGGSSFAAPAVLGTLDNNSLSLSTFGSGRVLITATGSVGVGTTVPAALLDIYGTGNASAILIPRDVTNNRPSGVNGMLRYNTSTFALEGYINNGWAPLATGTGTSNYLALAGGTMTGAIVSANGTVAAPGISFANSTSTGLYSTGAATMSLATGGTQRMVIDSSGNVGVGTASPNALLELGANSSSYAVNALSIKNSSATMVLNVKDGNNLLGSASTSGSFIDINPKYGGVDNTAYQGTIWSAGSLRTFDDIQLFPTGTAANNTPSAKLRFFSRAYDNGQGAVTNMSGYAYASRVDGNSAYIGRFVLGSTNTNYGSVNYSDIDTMILTNGNVGIGTTSPGAILDVNGTGTSSAMLVPRDTTANRPTTGINGMLRYNTNTTALEGYINNGWTSLATGSGTSNYLPLAGGTMIGAIVSANGTAALPGIAFADTMTGLYSTGAGNITASTAGVARMTINSSGNVGIGTISPDSLVQVNSGATRVFSAGGSTGNGVYARWLATENWIGGYDTTANAVAGGSTGRGSYIDSTKIGSKGVIGFGATDAYSMDVGLSRAAAGKIYFGNGTANDYSGTIVVGNVGAGTTSPQALLDVYGSGSNSAIIVPRATIAQRPTTAVNGMIRYQLDNNTLETYANGAWTSLATAATTSNYLPLAGGTMTGAIVHANGTVAAPGISFANDLTSGMYSTGAGSLSLATYGTGRIVIGPTGNVGIGITSPSWPLQVTGNAAISSKLIVGGIGTPNYTVDVYAVPSASDGISVSDGTNRVNLTASTGGYGQPAVGTTGAKPFTIMTNGLERARFDISGSVGVGTTTPAALLDIYGSGTNSAIIVPRATIAQRPTAAVNGMIRYQLDNNTLETYANGAWTSLATSATTGNYLPLAGGTMAGSIVSANGSVGAPGISFANSPITGLYSTGAATMSLATGGTQRMVIDSSGNVGIGTISPLYTFVTRVGTHQNIAITGPATNASGAQLLSMQDNGAGLAPMEVRGSAFNFTGGNVGVGTTAPGALLDVYGSGTTNSAIIVPRATVAQRPTAAVNGMIRYQLDNNTLETYANGNWTSLVTTSTTGNYLPLVGGTMAGSIVSANGTVGAPGISFANSPSTGLYSTGAATMSLATGGSQRMVIDSSGNVGIGTTNPASPFHVTTPNAGVMLRLQSTDATVGVVADFTTRDNNSISLTKQIAVPALITSSITQTGAGITLNLTGSATDASNAVGTVINDSSALSTAGAKLVSFRNAGVEKSFIAYDGGAYFGGNVGIGTTSPSGILDIAVPNNGTVYIGSSGVASTLQMTNGQLVSNSGLFKVTGANRGGTANGVTIETNSLERLRVDTSGNVGIGTTSAGAILDVNGSGATQSAMLVPRDSSANRPNGLNGMLRYNTTTAKLEAYANSLWQSLDTSSGTAGAFVNGGNSFGANAILGTNDNYNLSLYSSGAARMTILSNGNVGIGTTNPVWPLEVTGNILSDSRIYTSSGTVTFPGFAFSTTNYPGLYSPASNTLGFVTNAVERLRIDGSGNVGIGTTSPSAGLHIAGGATAPAWTTNGIGLRIDPATYTDTTSSGTVVNDYIHSIGSPTVNASSATTYSNIYTLYIGKPVGGTNASFSNAQSIYTAGSIQVSGTVFANNFTAQSSTVSTNGMYLPATNTLGFSTNSTSRMNIDAAGNVGIGTASPAALLDLYGTGNASAMILPRDTTAARPGTSVNGMLRYNTTTAKLETYANSLWQSLDTSNGAAGAFVNGGNSFGVNAILGTNDNYNLSLYSSGAARMTILPNGNVGIGTTSPSLALDVQSSYGGSTVNVRNNSTSGYSAVLMQDNTGTSQGSIGYGNSATVSPWMGNTYFSSPTAPMIFVTAATERMRVTNAGNVGIGTTAPATTLDLNGALSVRGMAAPALSPAGQGRLYFDSGSNALLVSQNGGAYTALATTGGVQTFASDITMSGAGTGLAVTNNETVGGTLAVTGATTLTGGFTSAGVASVTNTTASTSTTTGAETIAGGLGVAGTVNAGILAAAPGTAAAPSHAFTADLASGLWQPAAGSVAFSTAGVERARLTNTGALGLGTTAPAYTLDVMGGARFETTEIIQGNGATSGSTPVVIFQRGEGTFAAPSAVLAGDNLGAVEFGGYNTSSYTHGFDGGAFVSGFADQAWTTTANGAYLTFNTTADGTNSATERLRISSAGNVGIGTTSPGSLLHIHDPTATNAAGRIRSSTTNVVSTIGSAEGIARWFNSPVAGLEIVTNTNHPISFGVNQSGGGTPSMVIATSGNVGIGTTAPGNLLHVYTATASAVVANFQSGTGSCTVTPNSGMACSSDQRLKENIVDIPDALSKVLAVRGVTFQWKEHEPDDRSKSLGFIAQEVEKVTPELVREDVRGFKQVNYANFVAVVAQAIKEFYARWTTDSLSLHRDLAAVEADNSALHADNAAKAREIAAIKSDNEALRKRLEQQAKDLAAIKQKLGL